MHQISMIMPQRINNILIISCLSGIWMMLCYIQKQNSAQYEILSIYSPPETSINPYRFTFLNVQENIKNKKKISILLDDDNITNKKKLDLIRYEAQKLKYTRDTMTVVSVSFTEKTEFQTILQLVRICETDNHYRYLLVNKGFIIWGEYPPPPKIAESIQLMDL